MAELRGIGSAVLCAARSARAERLFYDGRNTCNHRIDASRVGMNAIGKQEFIITDDALQHERIQRGVMARRQISIDRVECAGNILRPCWARQSYPPARR